MQRPMNQKVAVSVVFVLAMFINIMDATIVNVALPQMGRDLGASPTAVSAVVIGYLVSLAVVIPASGWLGDRFGTRRVLLAAIVVFTVASALCGVAQTFGQLVVFRVLQGVGGGMLTPVGMAMLFRAFPPQERVRASSILTTPTALAPALGPVLGGLLVTSLSWRWVFYVNLPVGAFALAFGLVFLREQPGGQAGPFDLPGFVLSGLGFAGLMFGLSEGPQRGWGSTTVLVSLAGGVVLLAAMVRQQLRAAAPLLRLRLFSDRLFRSTTSVAFLSTASFLGVLYLVASRADLWPMRLLMLALGYGVSHVFVPSQAAAFSRIPAADTGRGSTLFNAVRQLGGAIGVTVLTTAVTLAGGGHTGPGAARLHPYHVAFLVAAGLALAGATLALTVHDRDAAATRVSRGRPAAGREPATAAA